ncbi:MAG: hypothetical protein EA353_08910 [Puniceicoccaceae bacterium]|nr:MAG: hypothetical protein EA353_08910 [Puniceicoccaceae bacterium]
MIDKIIKNVLELHGVEGACILDKKGKLLHNELPDFFLDDFLDDLARRIMALYEAVDENYMACNDYLLKFPQKYLYLRRSRNILLLVAVDPSVNLVSLRMVTNLVLKHVTPKVLSEMRASMSDSLLGMNVNAPVVPEPLKVEAPKPAEEEGPAATSEKLASDTADSEPEAKRGTQAVRGQTVARPRPARSFRGTRY